MAGKPLILYYESTDPPPLSLLQSPYTTLVLCFLHPHEAPDLTMFLNDTRIDKVPQAFWDNVGALRSGGMKVLFSIGGYKVGDWVNLSKNTMNGAAALLSFLVPTENSMAVDGFDFDWEDWTRALPYDPTELLLELVTYIRAGAFNSGFNQPILTVSPISEHLHMDPVPSIPDYKKILANVRINWINVQFYAGGEQLTVPLFQQIVKAGFPARKLVIGVEANGDDGTFPCGLLKTVPAVISAFPDTLGMFIWKSQRAGPNVAACANLALNGTGTCADCTGRVRGLSESAR